MQAVIPYLCPVEKSFVCHKEEYVIMTQKYPRGNVLKLPGRKCQLFPSLCIKFFQLPRDTNTKFKTLMKLHKIPAFSYHGERNVQEFYRSL